MEHDARINMRLPAADLERVDAFADALRESTGVRLSRAESVRVLLDRALDAAPELRRRKR